MSRIILERRISAIPLSPKGNSPLAITIMEAPKYFQWCFGKKGKIQIVQEDGNENR